VNLIAFYVTGGELVQVAQAGIIDRAAIQSGYDGRFSIYLSDNESLEYQVTVSNDATPICWSISERNNNRFILNLFQFLIVEGALQQVPYNPETRCTVTIEV
jgi:hypothetical protein